MQLKINDEVFELTAFIPQKAETYYNYLIRMPKADSEIFLIESAEEFTIISGESETYYPNVICTQYRVYMNGDVKEIEYCFHQEVGKRVDELNERISALEVSQQDQDDIIVELLSM